MEDYQDWALSLNQYKSDDLTSTLLWMGNELGGEVGELQEIFAKNTRKFGEIDIDEYRIIEGMQDELGDIVFWVASICERVGLSLDDVIAHNVWRINKRLADAQNK